jgi:hypothetical protein
VGKQAVDQECSDHAEAGFLPESRDPFRIRFLFKIMSLMIWFKGSNYLRDLGIDDKMDLKEVRCGLISSDKEHSNEPSDFLTDWEFH